MSFTWTVAGSGWADCTVADARAEACVTALRITRAPEELMAAVARLLVGETEAHVQFEAGPTAYRWSFLRDRDDEVEIRLLELNGRDNRRQTGAVTWSSRQTIEALGRAMIRGFDQVAHTVDEDTYRGLWGSAFPRTDLEALRKAWRDHRESARSQAIGDGPPRPDRPRRSSG